MVPNAPKLYEMHQNMSLGSNGMDQVRLFGKITTWLRGTNFCINCTSSVCFAPSFMQLRNYPKCTQTLWNIPKHEFRVQWGGSGAFVAKNFRCDFIAQTCSLIAPVQPILHRVSCSIETLPNALKCYEMQQNKSLGSTWLDMVCSLWKIPRRLQATNLSINCTSSSYFAPSFV